MGTTIPADPSKANSDAGTDDPQQSLLTDVAGLVDWCRDLADALGGLAQMDIGDSLGNTSEAVGTPNKLQVAHGISAKSATFTAVEADRGKIFICTGTITCNLTAAADLGDGWFCWVSNNGTGTITIDPNGSETVEGQTTYVLEPNVSVMLFCSGSTFYFGNTHRFDLLTSFSTPASTDYLAGSGGNNMRRLARADAGEWIPIERKSPSASSAVTFESLPSHFKDFALAFSQVGVTVDEAGIGVQVGTGGGPTYQTATNYAYQLDGDHQTSGTWIDRSGGHSSIILAPNTANRGIGNAATESFQGRIEFSGVADGAHYTTAVIPGSSWLDGSGDLVGAQGRGAWNVATAITALQAIPLGGGNIDGGQITLFGRV